MKFKYSARNQEGESQTGFVEAVNQDAAIKILQSHNLFILSMENVAPSEAGGKRSFFGPRVKLTDLMVFTRQFAILLESKIPLSDGLRALYQQTQNLLLKSIIAEISRDIESGLSLSQALERQNKAFSDFYINMVRSAEITGRMEEAMGFLADHLERDSVWRNKIKNALTYPVIVIVLFLVVAIVMLTVVFPQLAPIFAESDVQLPFIAKIFLGSGDFLLKWWWAVGAAIAAIIAGLIDYFRSDEGKIVRDEIVLRLPIFGNLFRKIYVARFAESASVLIKGGIPVAQALEITGHAVGSLVYQEVIMEVVEGIRSGELMSSLLAKNGSLFPPLVSQMVAIGEGSGKLDEILSKISSLYSRDASDILGNLTELIQPLLMAGIGIFVGLLFASVLVPIYTLIQGF